MWYNKVKKIVRDLPKDNNWYTSLANGFGLESLDKDQLEDLDISQEDLPF